WGRHRPGQGGGIVLGGEGWARKGAPHGGGRRRPGTGAAMGVRPPTGMVGWLMLALVGLAVLVAAPPMLGRMAAGPEAAIPADAARPGELGPARSGPGEASADGEQIWVLSQGSTLWGIAREVAPAQAPRRTAELLRQVTGLRSAVLEAGQRLTIPGVWAGGSGTVSAGERV